MPPAAAAHHRRPVRHRAAAFAITVTAALSLAATGCSSAAPPTISAGSAARQISAQLAGRYGLRPPAVSCPSGVTARKGHVFVCTTTLAGQPVRLNATVTDNQGRFSIAPDRPILVPSSVAGQLTHEITSLTGRPATVHCPGGPVVVVPVHGTMTCNATFSGEPPREVVVTVVDQRGDFGFQLAPPA